MPPKRTPAKAPARAPVSNARKAPVNAGKKAPASNTGKKPAGGKVAPKEVKKEVKKGPSPQDLAAIIIQKYTRRLLAKLALKKLKEKKKAYDETIENIQREAYVAMVKAQQEAAEKELEREEEERRRKREEAKRKKRMLEAAFDGDLDEMQSILNEVSQLDDKNGIPKDEIGMIARRCHQMAVVECQDANENTPLSEAGGGGSVDAIVFLVERGGNPNSIGAWGRTPLYRAAFGGHMEAVECLLQFGADPRTYAHDGNTPAQVASVKQIVDTLENWDVEITEALLEKMEAERERRKDEDLKRKAAETSKIQNELEEVQRECNNRQRILEKAYVELEKRIHEHDTGIAEGFDRPDVTLAAIQDAEGDLEIAKLDAMKAREALEQVKLKLRETQSDGKDDDLPGVKCNIRELDEVLMRDVGNRIKSSGKWPLLIDPSGQAAVFLRYRDTNYICALNPENMKPETLRLGLLGALRYGKPLVIDMLEIDMYETVCDMVNQIRDGLMDQIMNKEILEEKNYIPLVKTTDPSEYQKSNFHHHRVESFILIIVTKNKFPPENLTDITYPIRIVLPEPTGVL
ncbi:IQ motif and ankyrin repeat domain-containing protein 1-like [Ciona intestinalis]